MISLFIISLFSTFFITRYFAHKFHDFKNYGKKNDKSKTFTGLIRKKSGWDIHHIHIGLIIIFACISFIFFKGLNNILIIFISVGISLVADQIIPFFFRKTNYFSFENLIASFALHVIISLSALIFFKGL